MINVFVADDDTMVRQWLRFCIERAGDPYRLAGESTNGDDAVRQILSGDIQVAILDVMMPGFNGLEVIPRLKDQRPDISIMMLTNYAEFSYIQKAVRMGAEEYYLKSEITEEELLRCLGRIAAKKHLDCRTQGFLSELDSGTVRILTEQVLQRPGMQREEFLRLTEAYPPPKGFKSSLFAVAVRHVAGDLPPLTAAQKQEMSRYLSQAFQVSYQPEITLLVCEMGKLTSRLMMYNAISDMLRWLRDRFSVHSIGVSNIYNDFSDFGSAVREAYASMEHGFYRSPGAVTYIWDFERQALKPETLRSWSEEILQLCRLGSHSEVVEKVALMFDHFAAITPADPGQVRDYCLELTHLIRSVYLSKSPDAGIPGDNSQLDLQREYRACAFLSQLRERMLAVIRDCPAAVCPAARYSEPVSDALRYIREHYCEPLSLREVSQQVHMNTDYLGKLFKKETGVSFNAYVTRVKMEHADYLIRNTNLKKYEVSEKLGYANFSYFSRIYNDYKARRRVNV